jgi:hypothetical protein
MSAKLRSVGLVLSAVASLLAAPRVAKADGFAEPPPGRDRVAVAGDGGDDRFLPDIDAVEPKLSIVRFVVGPAGKFDGDGAAPGLLAAIDIGRGPTGFRATGAWLDVGADEGVAQYTGELTIDFGGRSRIRPVIGAGGGVARTSSSKNDDGSMDTSNGSTLGVGIVRAGVAVRLPFEEADARVGLDLTGTLPAIRAKSAPDVGPWALAALTVAVGF